MDGSEQLYNILKLAFGETYSFQNADKVFGEFKNGGIQYKKYDKNIQLINSGAKLNKIYLLLTGKCHVVKFSAQGKSVIADTMSPVQLFGLYEMLSHTEFYSATITSVGKCSVLEIPADYFRRCLESDIKIALITLEYLAIVMEHSLDKNDSILFNTGLQNLAVYLRRECSGKKYPHTLTTDRKTMSEELNINLRTLYRYMSKLKNDELIGIEKGKIVVNEQQAIRLSQIVNEIQ